MTHIVGEYGITVDGKNYPFVKPEGFDEWLKTKQDAFVQGVLYVYVGTASNTPTPQPSQEQLL